MNNATAARLDAECQDGSYYLQPYADDQGWMPVCRIGDLPPERGVAALVRGRQVAVFRLHDGTIAAVGNRDPFSGANVIARGLVGTKGEIPVVFSPMYKQAFSLLDGSCLSDPAARLDTFAVRVNGDNVEIALAG